MGEVEQGRATAAMVAAATAAAAMAAPKAAHRADLLLASGILRTHQRSLVFYAAANCP